MAETKSEPAPEPALGERVVQRKDGNVELTHEDFWKGSMLPVWLQNFITDSFVFITIHYNLWFSAFVLLAYYMFRVRMRPA
jgi:hypothetical protein